MSFLPTASHAASAFGMSFVPISSMQHVCGGVQCDPLQAAQPPSGAATCVVMQRQARADADAARLANPSFPGTLHYGMHAFDFPNASVYNATTYFFWSESIALAVAGSFGAAAACSTWWLARELNALRARGKLADEDAGRPQIALSE